MTPEPNDLLLFARIAEAGSLSAAALRLALPKSTVSRRLSALEAQLGERLIQRTTRGTRGVVLSQQAGQLYASSFFCAAATARPVSQEPG